MNAVYEFTANEGGVELNDFWECDLKEYTFHFIWCCYAIVHAIELYDQYKTSNLEAQV